MVVTFWATWQGRQLPPQHAIKMVSVLGPPRKMLEVTISRIRHLEYMVSKTMLFQPNVQGVKYRSIDLGTRAGLDPGPWLQQASGPGPACTKCLQEAVTSAPPNATTTAYCRRLCCGNDFFQASWAIQGSWLEHIKTKPSKQRPYFHHQKRMHLRITETILLSLL